MDSLLRAIRPYLSGVHATGSSPQKVGEFLLNISPLFIMYSIFGNGHVSLPAAFSILLAGVLLLLVATALEQMVAAMLFLADIPGAVCERIYDSGESSPRSSSGVYPSGNNISDARNLSSNLPTLPDAIQPLVTRPVLSMR